MKNKEIYIEAEVNKRLDLYLSDVISNISRTEIQKLIKNGNILVNGKKKKAKYLPKPGDKIIIQVPKVKKVEILPENIPLDIIYEDDDIAVINKPQGMIVHPARGIYSKTLVNSLLYNFKKLSSAGGKFRPGIVHRLDKDTSGLLIIAKNDFSHQILSKEFMNRSVKREYIVLVEGVVDLDEGTIDEPIGRNPKDRRKRAVVYKHSRPATTYYKVLERFEKYTLLKASLETGRTHQIRVHFAHINHSVVGDPMYAKKDKFNLKGQLLHSVSIGFNHPRSGEYMEFSTEIPERFKKIIKIIG